MQQTSDESSTKENNRSKVLAALVIRNKVMFPGGLLRLFIGKEKSTKLVEAILGNEISRNSKGISGIVHRFVQIAIFTERPPPNEHGTEETFYETGCLSKVLQVSHGNESAKYKYSLLVQGVERCRLQNIVRASPFLMAQVAPLADLMPDSAKTEVGALTVNLRRAVTELLTALLMSNQGQSGARHSALQQVRDGVASAPGPVLADMVVPLLEMALADQQGMLEEQDLTKRLRMVLERVQERCGVLEAAHKIQNEVASRFGTQQKEYFLRQQLKAIQRELGEAPDGEEPEEMEELQLKLDQAKLPEEAKKAAGREMRRLRRMNPAQPDHHIVRTYLELLADLPWSKEAAARFNVQEVQESLDHDHYGLDKVKRRILEYLAVRSLNPQARGPIMCLVGPPGVGKTSLGRSVANALQRPFQRLSLGGVSDEAEIRGHRRTYIGALPGSIISCMKKAGARNPVLLLDEIDKLGSSFKGGDPSAALLEVLDPEQNCTFTDHYLNLPFDLSSVFFIATANQTETIPEPLLDRMELIQIPGYTSDEKLHIAERYLLPKQLQLNGLTAKQIEVPSSTISCLAANYTREAGVRQLERELAAVCRSTAFQVAKWRETNCCQPEINASGLQSTANRTEFENYGEGSLYGDSSIYEADASVEEEPQETTSLNRTEESSGPAFPQMVVTAEMLVDILGQARYQHETAGRLLVPGVVTGMAWTPAGGELLFVECTKMPGKGTLNMTGKLGDVMKESATIAMSWIRANELQIAELMGCSPALLRIDTNTTDFHFHVPAGAIPKDGPSAGVAITTAFLSLLAQRTVPPNVAMTGEVTLRGLVLPVGGVKEKVLAAHKGGITHVILPERNRTDLEDLPQEVREGLEFSLVETVADVCSLLFNPDVGNSQEVHSTKAPHFTSQVGDQSPAVVKGTKTLDKNIEPLELCWHSMSANNDSPPVANDVYNSAAGWNDSIKCMPVLQSLL